MLSPAKIVRFAIQGRFGRLLEEVTRNGHPLPEPLRARLAQPDSLGVSAVALGLRRLLELEQYGGAARADLAAMTLLLRGLCESPTVGRAALAMALGAAADANDRQRTSAWVIAPGGVRSESACGLDLLVRDLTVRLGLLGAADAEHRPATHWDALDAATLLWQLSSVSGLESIVPGLTRQTRQIEARVASWVGSEPAVRDLWCLAHAGAADGRLAA